LYETWTCIKIHQIDQNFSKIFNPQTKATYYFITKHIQTPIKIPQIHHQHAIGLKIQNQTNIKTKNHAFSVSLKQEQNKKQNYHNESLSNLKHV
jgi:hypothetical protein